MQVGKGDINMKKRRIRFLIISLSSLIVICMLCATSYLFNKKIYLSYDLGTDMQLHSFIYNNIINEMSNNKVLKDDNYQEEVIFGKSVKIIIKSNDYEEVYNLFGVNLVYSKYSKNDNYYISEMNEVFSPTTSELNKEIVNVKIPNSTKLLERTLYTVDEKYYKKLKDYYLKSYY